MTQNVNDCEIILVDDGSPDRSGAMCDAWAEKDSRIKVIHKENGGQATARNKAVEISRGDYIFFVDSALLFSSMRRTTALPVITPSAYCFRSRTCSGVEMPKPRILGIFEYLFTFSKNEVKSVSRCSLTPVTPVDDTQ